MNGPPFGAGDVAPEERMPRTTNGDIERTAIPRNERPIHLLVFTSLYPNTVQPRHGIFVEERLRHLIAAGGVAATVVAPVPWFPFSHRYFGRYGVFARVPASEVRHGIRVEHPRYPVIPKFGMNVAPSLMYWALLPVIRRLLVHGHSVDLIDAHYFYPDGVAAARMGLKLDMPVVITARGNDVTLIPSHHGPRRQILHAANRAAAVVTVSQALKQKLKDLGAAADKITVLRNGVDLGRFGQRDRTRIRAKFDLAGPTWLTVGHLIERKGVHLAIEALALLPDVTLLIVGDGPEENRLRNLGDRFKVADRVRFLGAAPHEELCDYYNAADALVHPASREGMPNVVLESLACGTPVVAAPFDGVTELLDLPEAGEIAKERTAAAIAAAWLRLRDRAPARAVTRAAAERLGWQPVVEAQCALYQRVLCTRAQSASQRDGA